MASPVTTDVDWLSDSEQQAWRGMLLMYQQLFDALDKQLRSEHGIPHTYYEILAMLSEAPDRKLRMAELARLTSTSQSRTSHAVAALEERGWVSREQCPEDRRGNLAALTDEGWDAIVAMAPGHVAEVRKMIFDHLSDADVKELSRLTAAILGAEPR